MQIRVSDIDFAGKDLEHMELLHKMKMYPPRVKITIAAKSQDVILKIPVKFEGCSSDSLLDTELVIHPGQYYSIIYTLYLHYAYKLIGSRSYVRSASSSTSSSSPSTCSFEPQSHTIYTSKSANIISNDKIL